MTRLPLSCPQKRCRGGNPPHSNSACHYPHIPQARSRRLLLLLLLVLLLYLHPHLLILLLLFVILLLLLLHLLNLLSPRPLFIFFLFLDLLSLVLFFFLRSSPLKRATELRELTDWLRGRIPSLVRLPEIAETKDGRSHIWVFSGPPFYPTPLPPVRPERMQTM